MGITRALPRKTDNDSCFQRGIVDRSSESPRSIIIQLIETRIRTRTLIRYDCVVRLKSARGDISVVRTDTRILESRELVGFKIREYFAYLRVVEDTKIHAVNTKRFPNSNIFRLLRNP